MKIEYANHNVILTLIFIFDFFATPNNLPALVSSLSFRRLFRFRGLCVCL